MEFEDKPTRGECPFCSEEADCEHLVLRVNLQNQCSEGGKLSSGFDASWERVVAETGEDGLADHETLVEFLSELSSVVDYDREWASEGGPGASFDFWDFYCERPGKLTSVSRYFGAAE
jgi:hypothetical protein